MKMHVCFLKATYLKRCMFYLEDLVLMNRLVWLRVAASSFTSTLLSALKIGDDGLNGHLCTRTMAFKLAVEPTMPMNRGRRYHQQTFLLFCMLLGCPQRMFCRGFMESLSWCQYPYLVLII